MPSNVPTAVVVCETTMVSPLPRPFAFTVNVVGLPTVRLVGLAVIVSVGVQVAETTVDVASRFPFGSYSFASYLAVIADALVTLGFTSYDEYVPLLDHASNVAPPAKVPGAGDGFALVWTIFTMSPLTRLATCASSWNDVPTVCEVVGDIESVTDVTKGALTENVVESLATRP